MYKTSDEIGQEKTNYTDMGSKKIQKNRARVSSFVTILLRPMK